MYSYLQLIIAIRVCNRLRASFVYPVVPPDDFCIERTRPMPVGSLQSLREVGTISDSHILHKCHQNLIFHRRQTTSHRHIISPCSERRHIKALTSESLTWCDHVFVGEDAVKRYRTESYQQSDLRRHVKIIHIFCQPWKTHVKDGTGLLSFIFHRL